MKKLICVISVISVISLISGSDIIAQGGPPPPPPPPPPSIPIDGGIGFLIAAGLLYGAKKIYDSRKK